MESARRLISKYVKAYQSMQPALQGAVEKFEGLVKRFIRWRHSICHPYE
jgi:hypothetical protein